MPGSYLFLATATVLLLAASAVPATDDRMDIIGAHGAKRVAAAIADLDRWQRRSQAAKEEVAVVPNQFSVGQVPRAVKDGHLTYEQVSHNKEKKPLCMPHKSCAGRNQRGGPVARRPCAYKNHCAHGPPAEQAA